MTSDILKMKLPIRILPDFREIEETDPTNKIIIVLVELRWSVVGNPEGVLGVLDKFF